MPAPTHGMFRTVEYRAWISMRSRCFNPNKVNYAKYGGRGITVCDRWRNSFENFFADMGKKPSPTHTLDRINNDGNYEPENCRWATPKQQQNNRTRTRRVIYRGSEMTLADAITAAGSVVLHDVVSSRLRTGWSVKDAVERPHTSIRHKRQGEAA